LQKTTQSPERIAQAIKNLAEYHAEHSKVVKVTTIETGDSVSYPSIRQAAIALNTNSTTIRNYIKSQRDYLGKFNLMVIDPVKSNVEQAKGIKVTIIETGDSVMYPSVRQTAKAFNTTCTTIGKYINKQQVYLGKSNITKITTRNMSTIAKTDNVPMLYTQKLSNVSVKNLNSSNNTRVPIKKHNSPATLEWNNSVYAYNSKRTILLSAIDKIVIKLIKS
jgi:hypothetical protein